MDQPNTDRPQSLAVGSDMADLKIPNGSADSFQAANYFGFKQPNNETAVQLYAGPDKVLFSEYENMPDSPVEDTHENTPVEIRQEKVIAFKDLSCRKKATRVLGLVVRFLAMLTLLYFFICSLTLLSSAFTLIGGRVAGDALGRNPLLSNPICGLMIGVVATAFLQSSSTSTSIVITMVSSGILPVRLAIPIIMGSNIGTSITGILVAVTQAGDREHFRRAFAGATVHDMFNWLTVITLLPVEVATGYLYHLTSAIVNSLDLSGGGANQQFLSALTEPFTDLIVQIDKQALQDIAAGKPGSENLSLLKKWCDTPTVAASGGSLESVNPWKPPMLIAQGAGHPSVTHTEISPEMTTEVTGITPCHYMFAGTNLSEPAVGGIVLVLALVMLIGCLILMVKLLKSLLHGHMASVIQKTINADFPGRAACLTGYVAIIIGAIITVLVQSSSVVASALTPLVGLGLVTVERVYPMMLGANIGTTSTAILASFAASGDTIKYSLQIALCHLFFNLTGICLWYPVPIMRRVPIRLAKFLGRTTSRYRWFATLYLCTMFFFIPLTVFSLSLAGWQVLVGVAVPILCLILTVATINLLQTHKPSLLPEWMRTWNFLPEWMRSLAPLDRLITRLARSCSCCSCCSCCKKCLSEPAGETSLPDGESGEGRTDDGGDTNIDMPDLGTKDLSVENTSDSGISIISGSISCASTPFNFETAM